MSNEAHHSDRGRTKQQESTEKTPSRETILAAFPNYRAFVRAQKAANPTHSVHEYETPETFLEWMLSLPPGAAEYHLSDYERGYDVVSAEAEQTMANVVAIFSHGGSSGAGGEGSVTLQQ